MSLLPCSSSLFQCTNFTLIVCLLVDHMQFPMFVHIQIFYDFVCTFRSSCNFSKQFAYLSSSLITLRVSCVSGLVVEADMLKLLEKQEVSEVTSLCGFSDSYWNSCRQTISSYRNPSQCKWSNKLQKFYKQLQYQIIQQTLKAWTVKFGAGTT